MEKDNSNQESTTEKKDIQNKEQAEYEIDKDIKIKVLWFYQHKEREGKVEAIEDEENPNQEEYVDVLFTTEHKGKLILHWGCFKAQYGAGWNHPPKDSYPPLTKEFDKNALQTEFSKENPEDKEQRIHMLIPRGQGYSNAFGGINFVFFDPEHNKWYNNYRQDYQIKFKLKINRKKSKQILVDYNLYVPEFVTDIINCEANYGSWTLMHRYNKCLDILHTFNDETENEKWMWILIWLRYSYQRQLDWQRNYNTRPSLLSGAMNKLSNEVTGWFGRTFQKEKLYRNLYYSRASLIKQILSQLGKGTGNGQQIRDEILHIMHRNGIKETPDHFYEQWHQKLHNNTTPDDIVICEALIAFLKSGNIEDYRKTLKAGGIGKERLASYERKIVSEPWHNRNYLHDFENFLHILKSVHASTDLVMMYEGCKYVLGNNQKFEEIIRNKDDQDAVRQIRRVAEGREQLQNIIKANLNSNDKLRDLLFFEVSLEVYVRQLVEKVIHIKIDYSAYIEEISLILRNIRVSYPNFSEFTLCYNDWVNIVEKLKFDQSKKASLKVKSVTSRLSRLLASVIDYYNTYFDKRAKFFGKECGVDNYYSDMFAEELIRGSIFFALSMLLKKIEPTIRKNAQLGDWLIISRGKESSITGNLIHVPNLHEVQLMKYKEKTVILTENVSGNEEIPENCSCLVIINSENYPDILAHVSVRARNLNVPFSVCFNENKSKEIMKLLNKNVEVVLNNQNVEFKEASAAKVAAESEKETEIQKVEVMKCGDTYEKIFLELNEFNKQSVGAKSNNTLKIFGKIPNCDWVKYPESFAIPFNVNEYFLTLEDNKEIKEEIDEYVGKIKIAIKKEDIRELLEKCKKLTMNIKFVENSETQKLKEKLISFGIKEAEVQEAFKAIKSVWASKYNERVYIATSKVGISIEDIRMAVLVQKIIPAEYAYVIHTKNPSTNDENELFAEMVDGMGETLVGAYEGQSFSFSYNKTNKSYDIKSYPNKSISLKNSGFIFRSDSNTEDLQGFSGAGLFDSVPMITDSEVEMSYHNDKLFTDDGFVDNAINKIASLGIGVEALYNYPQDIEGVYYNGNFYIVQTRPQV